MFVDMPKAFNTENFLDSRRTIEVLVVKQVNAKTKQTLSEEVSPWKIFSAVIFRVHNMPSK